MFAADLFEKIENQGLLNAEAGEAYTNAILRKGGGRDPNQLLSDYLKRPHNMEAFMNQLQRNP